MPSEDRLGAPLEHTARRGRRAPPRAENTLTMASQLLFYERAVPVSSGRHRDMAVSPRRDFAFARSASAVPLTTAELAAAAADYAVVFVGEGDEVGLAALLGVRDNENLFVEHDGRWSAAYVPAFVRRYPFVFASQPDEPSRLALCVDEASDLVNRDGRGERLFDSAGERTTYLNNVLDFVQRYQGAVHRTRTFAKQVDALGLLRHVQAQLKLGERGNLQLRGFRTVDRDKLKALPPETVRELFASDALEALHLHLFSLRNLQRLAERSVARTAPRPTIEGDGSDDRDIIFN